MKLPAGFPTAAAITTAAPVAASATSFLTRPCFIDIQRPSPERVSVQRADCPFRVVSIAHFHKRKAPGTSGFPIGQDTNAIYRAIVFEKRSKLILGCAEIEIANENILQTPSSAI